MAIEIKSKIDVFKLALPLYDYLNQKGYREVADVLTQLVDSCFANDNLALTAHEKAYMTILEKVDDLPLRYKTAIEDAIKVIRENISSMDDALSSSCCPDRYC